jgi:hypothetical protein
MASENTHVVIVAQGIASMADRSKPVENVVQGIANMAGSKRTVLLVVDVGYVPMGYRKQVATRAKVLPYAFTTSSNDPVKYVVGQICASTTYTDDNAWHVVAREFVLTVKWCTLRNPTPNVLLADHIPANTLA